MVLTKSKEKMLFEGFSIFMLIVLFFILVTTAVNTSAPFYMVLFGFAPTLLTIIIGLLIYEEIVLSRTIIWLTPFVLAALFLIFANGDRILRENLDIASLAAINILFSAIYLAIFFVLLTLLEKPVKEKIIKKTQQFVQQPIIKSSPLTIKEYISSIEDKSKALNFVIGRVYNKYHGGSKELREIISIKPDWYNEFSESMQNEEKPDKKRMLQILSNFENKLDLLEKTEKEVFGDKFILSLKNLERNKYGTEQILNVLMKNDKDPVESYYKGAKEFCAKLKEELQK
ncbi:hypothetical protein COV13_02875 [Candidatus Woesearchaeota archaeon CG10_big_fil_rev_8_21_14_0_10_32_9]|nr:MAG: hypothetical protein COV13_02875 [Candidatus Woesearchaeota archaeon CG10_big_fil_rev_8_21_14_0_10_32_9]